MRVLVAAAAGVRQRRGWVFRDLNLSAEPGEIVAIVGEPGSGRTTVLLALSGRFRLSAGAVTLTGRAAIGHVPTVAEPEPVFTVSEHVRERLALLGRPARDADEIIAGGLLGLDPRLLGRDLRPYERQLLGLALAQIERPQIIALDGVDDGLNAAEQDRLWADLTRIAATGVTVIVTARTVDPDRATTIVHLGDPRRSGPDPAPVASTAADGAGEPAAVAGALALGAAGPAGSGGPAGTAGPALGMGELAVGVGEPAVGAGDGAAGDGAAGDGAVGEGASRGKDRDGLGEDA